MVKQYQIKRVKQYQRFLRYFLRWINFQGHNYRKPEPTILIMVVDLYNKYAGNLNFWKVPS
jgi:hypothetical protein